MIVKSYRLAKIKEEEISNLYKIVDLFIRNPNKVIYVVDDSDHLKGVISFGNFKKNYTNYKKMVNYNCIKFEVSLNNLTERINQVFNYHCNIFNIPIVDDNNKLLYEYENVNFLIKERWYSIYKNNENLAHTIKDLKYNKILFWCVGMDKEFQQSILKYFSNYSSWFEYEVITDGGVKELIECFKNQKFHIIIDLTEERVKGAGKEYFYPYIQFYLRFLDFNKCSILECIRIEELFDEMELNEFINKHVYKNKNIYFFESQSVHTLNNLTTEEKMRIDFNIHWSFYLKEKGEYFENLKKRILKKDYNEDFIDSRYKFPNGIIKNGYYYLNECRNPYCNVVNGIRITSDIPETYFKNIKIFGPCSVFGSLVKDSDTVPSYLQRMVNIKFKNTYRVYNYGLRGIPIYESIRKLLSLGIKKDDIIIFFLQYKEKEKISKRYPQLKIYNIAEVFNQDNTFHNYFFDRPIHCNYLANEKISSFVFSIICKSLNDSNSFYKKELIQINKGQTLFYNNIELQHYIKKLGNYRTNKNNVGAIVMNCNPFTKGHQYLIEYATKLVEILYVFVVEEDKSDFKFEDRIRLVKAGVRDLDNVIVLPSGSFIISSITFPEYFQKDEQNNCRIDTTLDLDIFGQYIAPTLNILKRFVGEEPFDFVTRQYNNDMKYILPKYGIDVIEIKRLEYQKGEVISASKVRKMLQKGDYDTVKKLVSESTFQYLINLRK